MLNGTWSIILQWRYTRLLAFILKIRSSHALRSCFPIPLLLVQKQGKFEALQSTYFKHNIMNKGFFPLHLTTYKDATFAILQSTLASNLFSTRNSQSGCSTQSILHYLLSGVFTVMLQM
jgi:hypothetical protein